jgi:coenzyme PQQ precursor peptide PqqA
MNQMTQDKQVHAKGSPPGSVNMAPHGQNWSMPAVEEICVALEINDYGSAEVDPVRKT